MADVTMNSAAIPDITPATADLLLAWDASASANGEFPISALITLLAATFATLTGGNTFTGNQTTTGNFQAVDTDNGAAEKIAISVGRNTNASTPAPGNIAVNKVIGSAARLFPDDTGIWRTLTTAMTNANYATASVVGAQSSSLDQKDVLGEPLPIPDILALIAEGAAAVRRFQYKATLITDDDGNVVGEGPRPDNGEEFSGVIVDYCGRYGTDPDDLHPNGKSLNTINVAGDLLIAVAWLVEQNFALTARVAALEGA